MRFADYFRVSLGNIARQKLRSSLTIFAVVIGATSVTVMLALVTGAKSYVMNQFEASGTLQQVAVSQNTDLDYDSARHGGGRSGSGGVKLSDDLVAKISAIPHVTGVSPTAHVGSFDALMYNGKKLTFDNVQAFEPNGVFTHTVLAGRDLQAGDAKGSIVLSDAYAKKLGFGGNYQGLVGQEVNLLTQGFYTGDGAIIVDPSTQPPQDPSKVQNQQPPNNPTTLTAKVIGIAADDDNGSGAFVSMAWAKLLMTEQHYQVTEADQAAAVKAQEAQQRAMRTNPSRSMAMPAPLQPKMTLVKTSQFDQNGYEGLTVKTDSTKNVEAVARDIRTLGVGAATAKSYVQQQLNVFNIVGLVLGGIGGIALLVAAIGVINTMVMAILERTREIGVMRACGATRAHVRRLFTFEAASLGFWGGAIGIGIGYVLIKVANLALDKQFGSSGVNTSDIISLPVWLIVAVIGVTTMIGMLAGLGPASRAARLNPVDALRYE